MAREERRRRPVIRFLLVTLGFVIVAVRQQQLAAADAAYRHIAHPQ